MYLGRLKLDGRRALVTGGASGIGLAGVEALAEMGAAVTIAALKQETIEEAKSHTSKAAVHQLTRSLAAEWGNRGVRVNAVTPTYIRTPLNEFADKEGPMSSVVAFLASDAASLMTGSIVPADGGYAF